MIKIILAALIVFYLITRLYQIGQLPQTVYWDEASIGYNAFSVTVDGKDEWGDLLPLHFRAFGEFKLPVYIYSVVPFVATLGLSAEAVRLPAVIFGLFTLIGCYLIGRKLFNNQAGLLTILFLIISPWFLLFSRVGYEVSAGLALFIWGIYFYLLRNNNPKYLIATAICLTGAMYSYNSYRVVVPLAVILGVIELVKTGWLVNKSKKTCLIISILILFICIIPIYRLINSEGLNRFQTVGLTRQTSQPLEMVGLFVSNYLSHFNPRFLFISGDSNPRSQVPGFGQLLWPSAVLLLIGLWQLSKHPKGLKIIIPLLLLTPIPASLTIESPHALRSLTMLPFLCLIMGLGFQWLIYNYRWLGLGMTILLLGLFGQFYWTFLTTYYPQNKEHWQYSYYQNFVLEHKTVVDDEGVQPYIFYLFYNRYDPALFRQKVQYNTPDQWGVSLVNQIGPVKFINNR